MKSKEKCFFWVEHLNCFSLISLIGHCFTNIHIFMNYILEQRRLHLHTFYILISKLVEMMSCTLKLETHKYYLNYFVLRNQQESVTKLFSKGGRKKIIQHRMRNYPYQEGRRGDRIDPLLLKKSTFYAQISKLFSMS